MIDRNMAAEADGEVAGFKSMCHCSLARRTSLSLCPRQTGEREVEGSSLVADRDRHVLDLELTDRLQHRPTDVRIDLDLEVIHALQRLMIFLAEHHLALWRVELHS